MINNIYYIARTLVLVARDLTMKYHFALGRGDES